MRGTGTAELVEGKHHSVGLLRKAQCCSTVLLNQDYKNCPGSNLLERGVRPVRRPPLVMNTPRLEAFFNEPKSSLGKKVY